MIKCFNNRLLTIIYMTIIAPYVHVHVHDHFLVDTISKLVIIENESITFKTKQNT